eukprot:8266782-Pyramimonas_sp.AAC.1
MAAIRFGGQLFAAVVAGGTISPTMMQIAECAKQLSAEGPSKRSLRSRTTGNRSEFRSAIHREPRYLD